MDSLGDYSNDVWRAMLAESLVEHAREERPASVRAFLLQQLRLIATAADAPKLGPMMNDKDPLVVDAAAAAMVSIGKSATKDLEKELQGAEGHSKTAIRHALNQLS